MAGDDVWLAGVDGCRAGWVAALVRPRGGEIRVRVVSRFADVVTAPEAPAVIAVDIPIGLPERVGPGGRAAENAVRPLLGARQSSVFSVPSRAAIAERDYRAACALALQTSDPPRKVSKQLFNIAPKIREVDDFLRDCPDAAGRIHETHPELAFWFLNGEREVPEPKKVKSRPYPPGLALRRRLLAQGVVPVDGLPVPDGAGADDLIDAVACALVARRIHDGVARAYPPAIERDGRGLRMAIWV